LIDSSSSGKKSDVDGSILITKKLLDAGVSNYDVDISLSKSGEFKVAHPSRLATAVEQQQQGHFQTVGAFLQQIAAKHAHLLGDTEVPSRGHPLVSIEPKFSDPVRIRDLVQEVVNLAGTMAARTALVASDDQVLQAIHGAMRSVTVPSGQLLPSVALAYRSRMTGEQFRWKDRDQHVDRYYRQLDSDAAAAWGRRPRRLILMPDIVLLLTPTTDGSSSTSSSSRSHPDRDVSIVAWIVDTKEALLQALSLPSNIRGVVTNQPIEMLQNLKEHYREHCKLK
jgi:hypothetical protein